MHWNVCEEGFNFFFVSFCSFLFLFAHEWLFLAHFVAFLDVPHIVLLPVDGILKIISRLSIEGGLCANAHLEKR